MPNEKGLYGVHRFALQMLVSKIKKISDRNLQIGEWEDRKQWNLDIAQDCNEYFRKMDLVTTFEMPF